MSTLYKRGKSYYLNWHDAEGQHRKSLGKISKAEAETRLDDKKLEQKIGKTHFTPTELFGSLAVDYLDWREAAFPDSHDRIKFIVEKRLTRFHERPVRDITQQEIERWIAVRSAEKAPSGNKIKPETVAKELRTLKAVFSKAIEWGSLETSPAKYVKAPKSHDNEPMVWYSADQLADLYSADQGFAPVWRLLANTGLRRTEAQQLRWSDVKADNIDVVSRAGARTKSGKSRPVPLSDGAVAALDTLREQTGGADYVLPSMTRQSLSRRFANAAKQAKLGGSLHSLRHTFAAHMVSAGVPLLSVQELCGHANFSTTERYAHLSPHALRSAVSVLNL